MNQYGRDQRDYIRFRESDSFDEGFRETDGSFTHSRDTGRIPGRNRYGEEDIRHAPFEDELGVRRWSDDTRSEASREDHSGKGPKGYQRSSERILEEANELLTNNPDLDASEIEVVVQKDILVLKGDVSSRHDKRLAESLVEDIPGIRDVHNHLIIRKNNVDGWIPGIGSVSDKDQEGFNG